MDAARERVHGRDSHFGRLDCGLDGAVVLIDMAADRETVFAAAE